MERLNDAYKKYVINMGSWREGFAANLYKDIQSNRKAARTHYELDKMPYFEVEGVCKYVNAEKPSRVFISYFQDNYYIEKKFNEFAFMWRKETAGLSTMLHISRNKYYNFIIGMGPDVVQFILKDLQNDPDWWFVALNYITKENPVLEDHIGNLEKMAEDWLEWGRKKHLI